MTDIRISKRLFVLVGALVLTFMAGAAVSTAYALLAPPDVDARQFNVTFAGATPPVNSMEAGIHSLVLAEVDGAFSDGQTSEMTVNVLKNSFTGQVMLQNTRECDTSGTNVGWCVLAGAQDWVVMPQAVILPMSFDDVTATWGPGYVRETGGGGMQGLTTYRATVQKPADPDTEGLTVTINVDGFANIAGGSIPDPGLVNYLQNPGFEEGSNHWNRATFGGRSIVSDQSHSGSNSLRMVASKRFDRKVNQEVAVSAGDVFDASVWAMTEGLDGPGAWVELMWLDSSGLGEVPPASSILGSDIIGPITGTNGWTELTAAGLTAPAGSAIARFNLWTDVEPDGLGTSWFDDVALLGP